MRCLMNTLVGLAVVAGFGCTMTGARPEAPQPTHRWIAQEDVSRAKYNFDNNTCIEESAVELHALDAETAAEDHGHAPDHPHLHRGEPEFVDYERCMNQRGYNLASY